MDGIGWNVWTELYLGRPGGEGEERPCRTAKNENQNLKATMRPEPPTISEKKNYIKRRKIARKPLINEGIRDEDEHPIEKSQKHRAIAPEMKSRIWSQPNQNREAQIDVVLQHRCLCDLLTSGTNITISTTGFFIGTIAIIVISSTGTTSSSYEIVFDHLILNFAWNQLSDLEESWYS